MGIKKDFVDLKLSGNYGERWACTDDELDLLYVAFEEGYRSNEIIAFLDDINYHKEARFFEAHEYFRGCGEYDGIAANMEDDEDDNDDTCVGCSMVRRAAMTAYEIAKFSVRRAARNMRRGTR